MNTIHENRTTPTAAAKDLENNNNNIKCLNGDTEHRKFLQQLEQQKHQRDQSDEAERERERSKGTSNSETVSCCESSEPESGLGSSRQNLEDDRQTTDDEERLRGHGLGHHPTEVATVNEKKSGLLLKADDLRSNSKQSLLQERAYSEKRGYSGQEALTVPRSTSQNRMRASSMSKTGPAGVGSKGPLRKPDFFSHSAGNTMQMSPMSKHRLQHKRQVTSADLYNKRIPATAMLMRQSTSDSLFTTSSSLHQFQDAPPLLRQGSKQSLYQKQPYNDNKLGNKKFMLTSASSGSDLSLQSRMLPFPSQPQLSIPPFSGSLSGNRNDQRGSQYSLSSFHRDNEPLTPDYMYNQGGSHVMDEDQREDSQGLTWRRLHMSRAKLKATATTSELLSGFAMIAMVELQINEPTNVPEWLFIMFSICTTILVAVHIFALMISTYLLPNIDAISKLQSTKLVKESPHERMRGFVELAWTFSTVFGLFLFLVEVAILCWVKFWDHSINAAIAATIIVIPVLVIFVIFVFYFYHNLVAFKFKASVSDMKELEAIKKKLDDADSSPV